MSQESDQLAAEVAVDGEVMAAIENDDEEIFVIANINCDDEYLTMPLEDTASLAAWQ